MPPANLEDRYSRQVILPGVGPEGQKKWRDARVLLAGEGPALQAAASALAAAGVGSLSLLIDEFFDPAFLLSQTPELRVEAIPFSENLPDFSLVLAVSEKAGLRRKLNRFFRRKGKTVLFGWPAGSGIALFLSRYSGKSCPCLECFEVLNPKAFAKGSPVIQRFLGAMAAAEALQWILKEESPFENKVWITVVNGAVSLQHELHPTYKCPALLIEEGAPVTP